MNKSIAAKRIVLLSAVIMGICLLLSSFAALHKVAKKSLTNGEGRFTLIATISRKAELSMKMKQAVDNQDFELLFMIGIAAQTFYRNGELTLDEYHELVQELKTLTRQ